MLEYELTDVPPPGYELSGPDNDAGVFLWSGGDWLACSGCGAFSLPPDATNSDFNLDVEDGELIDYGLGEIEAPATHADAKRIFDDSVTFDGWPIVSTACRDIVLRRCSTSVDFAILPREPNFFVLTPNEVLDVDTERSGHAFEPPCVECGRPMGAYGGTNCLRDPSRLDPFGMYRSDVVRGDVNRIHPAIFVGPELAHHLRPLNGVILYHALKW